MCKSVKNTVHTGHNIISCLCETIDKSSEKTFLFFCHTFTPFKAGPLPFKNAEAFLLRGARHAIA